MLINYFLMLVTLLLVSGLVFDAGLLEWRTIALQNAADAAAQEAMFQLAQNSASWAAAGQAQATANGYTNGVNGATVTITNPSTYGWTSGQVNSVQATLSQTVGNAFMGLANAPKSTISAVAVANILPTCIWIMGTAGSTSASSPIFHIASAGIRPSCGVYVNNTTGYNMGVDYFSTLTSTRIRVVGTAANSVSSGYTWPTARFGAAQKNDPLAYVTAPVFSSCTYSNTSISGGTSTLSPGTYCGMTISNATITFNPGLYIVTGGLSITGSTLTGSGVTFYMTQGGGKAYGTVTFTNDHITMSAPTSSSGGAIKGIFFFGDRNWVAHNSQNVALNTSWITVDGIWYVLNTGMSCYNNSYFYGPNYMSLVIDSYYQYLGNTYGSANYAPLSNVSPFHYDDGVLVQ